ncbi:hypothetical protein BC1002_5375 [Paraburkholderia atlantica]|uniref:Uncharacterized protein n=1 Tax=Paraburkholderia atlantica TaxID=2654982 RepID=D5WFF5_PARAM|nr:hypothetical protein BC1002_5375 [Paraburkholderia atlantica]
MGRLVWVSSLWQCALGTGDLNLVVSVDWQLNSDPELLVHWGAGVAHCPGRDGLSGLNASPNLLLQEVWVRLWVCDGWSRRESYLAALSGREL